VPTYEYVCQSCGTHVEVYQRFSDEPLKECGVCGGPLRKVFHPAGILFKGSGFYVTDSRATSSDRDKRAGGDKEKAGGDKKKAEGGKEKASSSGSAGTGSGSKDAGTSSSQSDSSKERSA